jgi:lipopolysaccharide transport system ATP-binding protein
VSNDKQSRETAIRLSGVRKMYKLGQIGGGSLQSDLQSWWARIHGREDPNSVIGQEKRLVGQTFMALNGIDLTVYKGEALGIIGANGAGKSTMLKLLSRVTAPTDGEIDIYGRVASMLEVGTGFHGELTGRENVYMNGAILGMTRAEIDAKMEDIIEFSEVREFIDTPVKRYSSGMYVKLAFSVAAHLDSEIMIMDEVLAVGDLAFQKKCLDKMREVASLEKRTVLYVSHNMNTIRQLCDRCIVLDRGKIIFDGDVEEAIEVYMGASVSLRGSYDYTKEYHTDKGNKDIYFRKLRFADKEGGTVETGGVIDLQVECEIRRPVVQVRFRFEIQYADGTPAAAAFTNESLDYERPGPACEKMRFNVSYLAPGQYKADMVAYSTDAYGNDIYLDGVIPGFYFEVKEDSQEESAGKWLHKYWGHVRLKDIHIGE